MLHVTAALLSVAPSPLAGVVVDSSPTGFTIAASASGDAADGKGNFAATGGPVVDSRLDRLKITAEAPSPAAIEPAV